MATITKFKAGWHPEQNKGRIYFQSDDGKTFNLDLANPAEFAVILAILTSSDKVTVNNGIIWTGAEDVADG